MFGFGFVIGFIAIILLVGGAKLIYNAIVYALALVYAAIRAIIDAIGDK